jgi:hypothetical protein
MAGALEPAAEKDPHLIVIFGEEDSRHAATLSPPALPIVANP